MQTQLSAASLLFSSPNFVFALACVLHATSHCAIMVARTSLCTLAGTSLMLTSISVAFRRKICVFDFSGPLARSFFMPRRCHACGAIYLGEGVCASGAERCNEIYQRFLRLSVLQLDLFLRRQAAEQAEPAHPSEPAEELESRGDARMPALYPPMDPLETALLNAGLELQTALQLVRQCVALNAQRMKFQRCLVRPLLDEAGLGRP